MTYPSASSGAAPPDGRLATLGGGLLGPLLERQPHLSLKHLKNTFNQVLTAAVRG